MYQNAIYTAGKALSAVMWPSDFANERLLIGQVDV